MGLTRKRSESGVEKRILACEEFCAIQGLQVHGHQMVWMDSVTPNGSLLLTGIDPLSVSNFEPPGN